MIRLPKALVATLGSDNSYKGFLWIILWMIRLGCMVCVISAAASFMMRGTDPSTNPVLPLFLKLGPVAALWWVIGEALSVIVRRQSPN